MSIDWSVAPEGTDAYCEGHWLKRDGDNWLQQPVNNGWEAADFKPWKQDGFIYKKDAIGAAEQREKGILEIEDVISSIVSRDSRRLAAETIYDSNYRKDDQ